MTDDAEEVVVDLWHGGPHHSWPDFHRWSWRTGGVSWFWLRGAGSTKEEAMKDAEKQITNWFQIGSKLKFTYKECEVM